MCSSDLPEPGVAIATMRYMQITKVTVRPGHGGEWEEYLKMFRSNLDKAEPGRHIALYQSAYGSENGGIWLLITPMKSLSKWTQQMQILRSSVKRWATQT